MGVPCCGDGTPARLRSRAVFLPWRVTVPLLPDNAIGGAFLHRGASRGAFGASLALVVDWYWLSVFDAVMCGVNERRPWMRSRPLEQGCSSSRRHWRVILLGVLP